MRAEGIDGVIISADSHVMEPVDLWKKGVPEKYRDAAPLYPPHKLGEGFQQREGGWDPNARITEMEVDGLSAEVLYPTLLLKLFALDDAGLQEACFRVYNDWLIEYCSVDRDRLIGVAAISAYNIDNAVKELERCRKAGLKGALVWQAPHPDLPFHSKHYDRVWAAAQDLEAPVSMHILTGHSYHVKERKGIEHYRGSVNLKLMDVANALFDFIFYGVLDLKTHALEYVNAGHCPPILRRADGKLSPVWHVDSVRPLTLSPSLLCTECGHHGFIRDGRWIPA